MKQIILAIVFLLIGLQAMQAQHFTTKTRYYRVNLSLLNSREISGWLAYLTDSSLYTGQSRMALESDHNLQNKLQKFDYSSLGTVRLQRKSSVGRGILYGAIAGTVAGAIAGFAQGDDPSKTVQVPNILGPGYYTYQVNGTSASTKAAEGAFFGAMGGAVLGGIIGALAHKTFTIGGSHKQFTEMKTTTLERIYASGN